MVVSSPFRATYARKWVWGDKYTGFAVVQVKGPAKAFCVEEWYKSKVKYSGHFRNIIDAVKWAVNKKRDTYGTLTPAQVRRAYSVRIRLG